MTSKMAAKAWPRWRPQGVPYPASATHSKSKTNQIRPKNLKQGQNFNPSLPCVTPNSQRNPPASQWRSPSRAAAAPTPPRRLAFSNLPLPSPSTTPLPAPTRASACASRQPPSRPRRPQRPRRRRDRGSRRSGGSCTCPTCPGHSPRRRSRSSLRSAVPSRASR
jgi:hypothetical protein